MPLPDKKCPRCNHALPTHGDGLGIPDDYIPCEYCFWHKEYEILQRVLDFMVDREIVNQTMIGACEVIIRHNYRIPVNGKEEA